MNNGPLPNSVRIFEPLLMKRIVSAGVVKACRLWTSVYPLFLACH
jgi:hypothetical protein